MAPEKVSTGAAFLLSDQSTINGQIFSMGGGRIARVSLAEGEGVMGLGDSIEDVRDGMPQVMSDDQFFYPGDFPGRVAKMSKMMGFSADVNIISFVGAEKEMAARNE